MVHFITPMCLEEADNEQKEMGSFAHNYLDIFRPSYAFGYSVC